MTDQPAFLPDPEADYAAAAAAYAAAMDRIHVELNKRSTAAFIDPLTLLPWRPHVWINSPPTSDPAGWWANGKHYIQPMSSGPRPPLGLKPRMVIWDEVDEWPDSYICPRTYKPAVSLLEVRAERRPMPWRLWAAVAVPVAVAAAWRWL